ncbi:MAG: hypothetical protein WA960_05120 [Tunicatimonas sp.]
MTTTILNDVKVAIDNAKLYVEVDASSSVLLYQWKGHILDDEAKAGFLQIIDLIKKNHITNVVADLFKFKGGTVETAKWVGEVISEKMKAAGVEKVAISLPESSFGEFSNRIALGEKFVSLLNVEKFTSAKDAYAWFDA